MTVTRRDFLATTAAGLLGCTAGQSRQSSHAQGPSRRPPNIVLVLADDLGYADISLHGCEDIPTPHIDSIAEDGVRFLNGYVSAPVCSPTRAGLMTGRYQQRFGWEVNPSWPVKAPGMSLDETTVAEIMRSAGYRTGLIGKWHLCLENGYHPQQRGFDEYYGLEDFWGSGPGTAYLRDGKYITDVLNQKSVEFIESNAHLPFFLFISHMAVHLPYEATEKYLDRFPHIEDPKRKTYAAMLSALDDGVGRVRETLRHCGIEEDTLVIFLNDNGGWTNRPLRGHKGTMYEGAVRVPFLARQPGTVPAGEVVREPVISLDILPTVAAVGGAPLPDDRPIDGVSLLPLLTGRRETLPREYLFWRMGEIGACRHGEWKLIVGKETQELYDLESDPGEKVNLSAARPRVLGELRDAYREWERNMMPPPRPDMEKTGKA
jgi:arylsulfatase A-like enzyme